MREGGPAFLAFTERGFALAQKLAQALGGTAHRCGRPLSLGEWTRSYFPRAGGLVFVGAVGIAVRAIAPYVDKKWKDPAVVAVDEGARFAVALLSGHLGGANQLAREVARACGAQAVVTTATDVSGVFPVDEWARVQGLWVADPQNIRRVSARLLAGDRIRLGCPWPIRGMPPAGVEAVTGMPAQVLVTPWTEPGPWLTLVPRAVTLGAGCRRGTSREALEQALEQFLARGNLRPQAVCGVATIDLKGDEPGLLDFCRAHGWPLQTFSAGQLRDVPGEFAPSPFVEQVTGVDNVCERSAVAARGGRLVLGKYAANGVTLAAALHPLSLSWDWGREEIDGK